MRTAITRAGSVGAVLLLSLLGFSGVQPALATDTNPPTTSEQPGESASPDPGTIDPLPIDPLPVQPVPSETPVVAPTEPAPVPVDPAPTPVPVPDPVQPPVTVPSPEPAAPGQDSPAPVGPSVPSALPTIQDVVPTQDDSSAYVEPAQPGGEDSTTPSAEPTPTPTPQASKTAEPPVASATITGPLKAALAPVAENSPLVQIITVLVLILLGVAYFRALRTKGVRGPRLNGK